MVRNTKAFKEAVAQTLAELARRGVTLAPASVEDLIQKQITTVSERLGIQVRSAWRYFDASVTADRLAQSVASYEESSSEKGVGQAPMPPIDNPELALVLAGVPDSLAQSGGDLYAVIMNVAVNAWMAGHIHGDDGCEGSRGDVGPMGLALKRTAMGLDCRLPGFSLPKNCRARYSPRVGGRVGRRPASRRGDSDALPPVSGAGRGMWSADVEC